MTEVVTAARGLDARFVAAQAAVDLPEVKEMMRKLSDYGLGIFMPHMHDARGQIVPLPSGMVQVEDDLRVSFKDADEGALTNTIPVGWMWDDKHSVVAGRCVSACIWYNDTHTSEHHYNPDGVSPAELAS